MICEEIRNQYSGIKIEPCCGSCHDDDDTGYGGDLWFTIDGKEVNVCCAVARAFEADKSWTGKIT